MSNSNITLVLLDVGNVIVRSTHAITYAILQELGVRADYAPLIFHRHHYRDFVRGKITGAQFYYYVQALLPASLDFDTVRVTHNAHIYMVDPYVLDLLGVLQSHKIPIGFVTTSNEWQSARVAELVDLSKFGIVADSWQMGVTKTDSGAWAQIMEKWPHHATGNTLFVDDSPDNIAAAGRAGLVTHQFDPTYLVGIRGLLSDLKNRGLLPNP